MESEHSGIVKGDGKEASEKLLNIIFECTGYIGGKAAGVRGVYEHPLKDSEWDAELARQVIDGRRPDYWFSNRRFYGYLNTRGEGGVLKAGRYTTQGVEMLFRDADKGPWDKKNLVALRISALPVKSSDNLRGLLSSVVLKTFRHIQFEERFEDFQCTNLEHFLFSALNAESECFQEVLDNISGELAWRLDTRWV